MVVDGDAGKGDDGGAGVEGAGDDGGESTSASSCAGARTSRGGRNLTWGAAHRRFHMLS